MGSLFQIRAAVLGVAILMMLVGCVPEARKPDVVYGPERQTAPVAPISLLDARITALRAMLQEGTLSEEDRIMAGDLLGLYEKIRKDALSQPPRYDDPEMNRRLFTLLHRFEEKYYSRERPVDQETKDVINRFSATRKRILENYLYGDYQGVVDECMKLESTLGPKSLTPEIGLIFALSLAKKGMLKEAVAVGEKIVSQMEGKPDLLYLQAQITEWHVMLGQKEQAIQSYEKLLDNLDGKEALLKRTEKKMTARETPSPGPALPPPPSDTEAMPEDLGSLESVLKRADELTGNKQFHEARMLLVKYRITLPDGPELETIDQALKKVDMAEQEHLDGEFAQKRRFQEGMTRAKAMIEEERFEEALAELEKLEQERLGNAETRTLSEMATEKLIHQERNKAAKLYLMARNTSDPEKKEELLLSSYNKLKVLIEKYPSSSLITTLNNNLLRVRDELRKLGVNPG